MHLGDAPGDAEDGEVPALHRAADGVEAGEVRVVRRQLLQLPGHGRGVVVAVVQRLVDRAVNKPSRSFTVPGESVTRAFSLLN